ncbi:MAG: DUF86 domain-containing protein [Thermoproteota archaeon]
MPVDGDVLRSRISDVNSTISELQRLASKPFMQLSIDEKYSIRYNIVVLVESVVSICMHIAVEAYVKTPATYREAVKIVAERLNLSLAGELESLVGLRNLLVHRYWPVEDEKVYEAVKNNFKCVEELLGKVREAFLVER